MDKKKKYLLIIGIFIVLLSVIGVTYAYWTITLVQDGENVVYTDCLNIEFTDSNNITLNNAYPMTQDELETDFFPNAVPYHFKLENKCQNKTDLTINLETLEVDDPVLKDEYVNAILWEGNANEFYATDKEILSDPYYDIVTNENPNKLIPEALKAYTLYQFSLYPSEIKEFNLILFMDEETPVSSDEDITNNAHWKSKVTINGQSSIETTGMLRKINKYDDKEGMWKYKEQIKKIVFENELNSETHKGDGVIVSDESALKDKSIMSYLVPNDEYVEGYEGTYTAYIQGDGEILANPDSSYLFSDFYNVESITGIDYLNTSNVTDMRGMFQYMSSLTSLDLGSQFNTRKVTNMNSMFNRMSKLISLNLGTNFDTSQVTDMNYMFGHMSSLTSLDLGSHFDTSNVEDMSYMFYSYEEYTLRDTSSSLTTLNLGSLFNTSNVKNMEKMFEGLDVLTTLDLSSCHFDTSKVTNMTEMFWDMEKLTTLNLGSLFNTSNVEDMSDMFGLVSSLTTLDLGSHFDTSQVTDMRFMFSEMNSLESLDLSSSIFNTSKVTNMGAMFSNLSSLTELNLGSHFDTSEVLDMNRMFDNLSSLTKLDLGTKFNTSKVEDMSSMFRNMSSLTELDLGSQFDTSEVTNMNYMFFGMSNLTHIKYGELFSHHPDATIYRMFDGTNSSVNKPDAEVHESWKGVDWT